MNTVISSARRAACGLTAMALACGAAPAVAQEPATAGDGVQVVEILGGGYFFKPDKVTVKANARVEFRVKKETGMVPHDFVIEAPEAGVQVKETLSDAPKTVRVTFTKPGTYEFYCSKKLLFFESHRAKGMKGTIEVTE